MARLLEFKSDEAELFEALSVIFFVTDQPSPAENKASIKAEDTFEKYGKPTKDSKFANVACGFCGNRIVKVSRIYTLPADQGADIVLDDKVFDYIESRFDKWQVITDPNLKRPFEALKDRLVRAKQGPQDYDDIRTYLEKRDKKD